MKITGTAVIKAPQAAVWAALNDMEVLARVVPGCESLNDLGDNHYEGVVKIGIAGIKGSYSGKIRLEDIDAPKHYKLIAAGKGSNGVVDAVGTVDLDTLPDGTTQLNYGGEAQIGGMLASVGQRLIEGAARQLIGQAVKALEAQILQRLPAESTVVDVPGDTTSPAAVDALNAAAARSAAEPVRKSVVLSESEQLKPETLVSGMVNEWLSTSTGKIVAVVVLFVLGFLVGRLF
jgi:carbon monoxide dehydrogenase subunit G